MPGRARPTAGAPGARLSAAQTTAAQTTAAQTTAAQEPARSVDRARRLAEAIVASAAPARWDALADADGDGARPRLPTERVLAEELGVSRAAVREALSVLAAEGRISREVGRGTFLVDEPLPARQPEGGDISPADVLAARRLIEPELLPLVVARATERDLLEIERCLAGGETATTTDEFEHWDLAFHHAIAIASHNPLLVRMYAAVEQARQGEIWGNLKRRGDSAERRAERQAEHRRIVEALRSREVVAAVAAMGHHLEQVTVSMLGEQASLRLVVAAPAGA